MRALAGRTLLEDKAPPRVRLVQSPMEDWLKAYEDLAVLTYGLGREDARFWPVMHAVDMCDDAFRANDWARFQPSRTLVYEIMGIEKA